MKWGGIQLGHLWSWIWILTATTNCGPWENCFPALCLCSTICKIRNTKAHLAGLLWRFPGTLYVQPGWLAPQNPSTMKITFLDYSTYNKIWIWTHHLPRPAGSQLAYLAPTPKLGTSPLFLDSDPCPYAAHPLWRSGPCHPPELLLKPLVMPVLQTWLGSSTPPDLNPFHISRVSVSSTCGNLRSHSLWSLGIQHL